MSFGNLSHRGMDFDDLVLLIILGLAGRLFFGELDKFVGAVLFFILFLRWAYLGMRISIPVFVFLIVSVTWVAIVGILSGHVSGVTVLGHFTRLLIGVFFVFIVANSLERLVYWVVYLAKLSLVLFLLGVIFPDFVYFAYDATPDYLQTYGGVEVSGQVTGGWQRASWLFYNFSPDRYTQNHGFMWEPAAFALVLNLVLWLRFFSGRDWFDRDSLVLIAAIASTVSTTAVICLLVSLCWMLLRHSGVASKIALLVVLIFGGISFFSSAFLLEKVVSEWNAGYSAQMQYALSRMASAQLDFQEMVFSPFLGVGISVDVRPFFDRLPSNNGLTDYVVRFGLVMVSFHLLFLGLSVRYYYGTRFGDVVAFVFVVLMYAWAEKFFELSFFYILTFAGFGLLTPRNSLAEPSGNEGADTTGRAEPSRR